MFKKLREVCRKHFHQVAPPKTSMVTSYDQKQCFCFVFVLFFVLFLLVLVALVVVLVLLGVVLV